MNKPQHIKTLQELDRLISAYESAITASDNDAAFDALESIEQVSRVMQIEMIEEQKKRNPNQSRTGEKA